MASVIDISKLFITVPSGASKLYHIFGPDDRSLCGKFGLIVKNKDNCQNVSGSEEYQKGQDCKACFDKMKKSKK